MTKESRAARLRELISKGAVMLPGVPNAAMARQVERSGFDAVYISGAGMANATAGVPDIGLLSMTEVVRLAGYIANAVSIPRFPLLPRRSRARREGQSKPERVRCMSTREVPTSGSRSSRTPAAPRSRRSVTRARERPWA